MRSLLAAVACTLALTSSAHAQGSIGYSLNDFLGTWYGENETVPVGQRRVVPVQIDISEIPSLRGPRRFNVRLVIRCIDRPTEVCDLGTAQITAIAGNEYQLHARYTPRLALPLQPCSFNMLLTSGDFPTGGYERYRKHGLRYSVSATRATCLPSEFTGITPSGGFVNRTPTPRLELPPDARPAPTPPILPPPRL